MVRYTTPSRDPMHRERIVRATLACLSAAGILACSTGDAGSGGASGATGSFNTAGTPGDSGRGGSSGVAGRAGISGGAGGQTNPGAGAGGRLGSGGAGLGGGPLGAGSGGSSAATTGGAGTGGIAGGDIAGGTTGGSAGRGAAGASSSGAAGMAGGGSVSCPTSVSIKAGDNTEMITSGGVARTYLVHAPPGYDGKTPVPVLFDFHGLSGTGAQQKSLSKWSQVGDQNGFITVFPDGVDNAWNAGLCCANDTSIDDVAFVRDIIKALQMSACVDPKRIYASGCSNGGGMSYKLACEAADVIAAVAPVDFDCVDGSSCGMCKPARPITEVQFRGTSDQLVAYDGNGAFLGAEKNFMLWGDINACDGSPAALASNSACEAYPMCGGSTQTVLCTVQNGMHCGNYSSFTIPQVAWSILKDQALP